MQRPGSPNVVEEEEEGGIGREADVMCVARLRSDLTHLYVSRRERDELLTFPPNFSWRAVGDCRVGGKDPRSGKCYYSRRQTLHTRLLESRGSRRLNE